MTGVLYAAEGGDPGRLAEVAREFSPRVDVCGPREIVLDLNGLASLFGDARAIAGELRRTAADRGLQVRIAVAGSRTAARLLVRQRAGITIVFDGDDAGALAPLPLDLLLHVRGHGPSAPHPGDDDTDADICATFRRWGLRTLGEVAALPAAAVAARLGQAGVEWQRLARGEDPSPLVPAVPEERFEQALDLEWPIEGLEPLSFVLGRLMEPLSAHLERRDRGAAVLHLRLHLVSKAVHERSLELPAPMRDARTLRTLALLDLESHPPPAAIDRVVVAIDPTPARVLQYSLLTRPLPSPEQVSTLMARLTALMGEGRCGSPGVVDSWRPGALDMRPFAPRESVDAGRGGGAGQPPAGAVGSVVIALRRFRLAVPARVQTEADRPVRVTTERRGLNGGRIEKAAGPWRTSGEWWRAERDRSDGSGGSGGTGGLAMDGSWDRDEWDVTVSDGTTYRLFRARDANAWFIDGVLD